MDTPTAKNQAAEAIRAPRPRQMRSGAIAAIGAIAVILAATAIPMRGGPSGPSAGYAPVAKLALNPLPAQAAQMDERVAVIDLGDVLGAFELPGLPAWKDYADGTAVLSVWFRSETIADAAFAGEIRFSRPKDGAKGAAEAIASINPAFVHQATFTGTSSYAKIEGELYGRGAYDGVMLRIEAPKGAIARRGAWKPAGGDSIEDAIFAQFNWTIEGDPVRDVAMPTNGTAKLAAKLSARGSN